MPGTVIIFLYLMSNIVSINSFFSFLIVEWNKLSRREDNSENIRKNFFFKKSLLEFTRPSPNSIFDIYKPCGIKLFTRFTISENISLWLVKGYILKITFIFRTQPSLIKFLKLEYWFCQFYVYTSNEFHKRGPHSQRVLLPYFAVFVLFT